MRSTNRRRAGLVALAAVAALLAPSAASAYDPTGSTVDRLPADEPCLKGRGNCAIYPKAAQLPNGRLVLAFEKSTVAASGGAAGQSLPVYTSDDYGASWQHRSDVAPPAELSDDPTVDRYTSNWTNPYLYVLPEQVGDLAAGTLLLASAVSGEDAYYAEHKAADPSWVPSNDGDRADLAIALFASTDGAATWDFVNIVATGGWQGGAAGATGTNIATANRYRQVDPVWEPYLIVHEGELVAYYSDENDHRPSDPVTGAAVIAPDNATAADSHGQVLVHRTWDGTTAAWSEPVMDVTGLTENRAGGTQIGGGRPGMANVVPTTDGRWLLTYEYWGGGANTRFKIADDPLAFFADGDPAGTDVGALAVAPGSRRLAGGGSPVLIALPDGRLVYNASGSGSVWVNESGRSDGTWTEFQTPIAGGYSRTLQYVEQTGRLVILQSAWGGADAGAEIRRAEVDLGRSAGAYYRLTNRAGGQVIGTGGSVNDANLGNRDVPDVVAEPASDRADGTQYWHLATKPDGNVSLLNRAGGRAAAVWTGNATIGQRIGQWVDDQAVGSWRLVPTTDGYVRLQSVRNPALYVTAPAGSGPLTLQTLRSDGTQEWRTEVLAPTLADLDASTRDGALLAETTVRPGQVITIDAAASTPGGAPLHQGTDARLHALAQDGTVTDLGTVRLDDDQRGTLTVPADLGAAPGTTLTIVVTFDATAPLWDVVAVAAPTPAWDTARAYSAGDLVDLDGSTWLASWWTRGQQPGDPYGPWQQIVAQPDGTAVWTPSRIFVAGDVAVLDGTVYQARWWTRDQRPGDPHGPWRVHDADR
jgi:chitodextrinase